MILNPNLLHFETQTIKNGKCQYTGDHPVCFGGHRLSYLTGPNPHQRRKAPVRAMKQWLTVLFLTASTNFSLLAQDAGFEQTVQFVQNKIHCCSVAFSPSVKRKVDSISIALNGNMTLHYSDSKPPQSFNLLKLHKEMNEGMGMDTIMNGKFIQFHVNPRKISLIRFATVADAAETYTALQKLFLLCKEAMLKFNDHPSAAIYFISRNVVLKTENEMLLNSIRCIDRKEVGDTVIAISSKGEGWLDKDSLPIGQWNFYANDEQGKEYLLKSGTYSRTAPAMFEVKNIDSNDLSNHYHLSYCTLQEDHVKRIPFIKSYNWNYYHPNGEVWKNVDYQVSQIPIILSISINVEENYPSSILSVQLKENPDEWINISGQ
jgi:hypothetical protein